MFSQPSNKGNNLLLLLFHGTAVMGIACIFWGVKEGHTSVETIPKLHVFFCVVKAKILEQVLAETEPFLSLIIL